MAVAARVELVSILARPSGRAQPYDKDNVSDSYARFNPRPSIRTGATGLIDATRDATFRFQSSPVHQDGRNVG